MSNRDARLRQFFSGYFNQDWDTGGATSWPDVVAEYIKENPRTHVLGIRDDLTSWLDETASANVAIGIPSAWGCDYNPQADGIAEREWIRQLVDCLERQLTS